MLKKFLSIMLADETPPETLERWVDMYIENNWSVELQAKDLEKILNEICLTQRATDECCICDKKDGLQTYTLCEFHASVL
jgi:hypothetical protein